MIRRPPRSTQSRSSAASDVYKRQDLEAVPVLRLAHGLEPSGHSFGVAVLATAAELRAASYRVPRSFGPLNSGRSHLYRSSASILVEDVLCNLLSRLVGTSKDQVVQIPVLRLDGKTRSDVLESGFLSEPFHVSFDDLPVACSLPRLSL